MIDDMTYRRLRDLRREIATREREEQEQRAIQDLHEQERRAYIRSRPQRRRKIGVLKLRHLPKDC